MRSRCWYGWRFPAYKPCQQPAIYGILLTDLRVMRLCEEHYLLLAPRAGS